MEASGPSSWSRVLVYPSLLLNVLLLAYLMVPMSWPSAARDGGGSHQLSWALQASMEAEAVAASDCSGHGRVYLDSVAGEDGRPGCECDGCFHGPDCSRRTLNCPADAESADQMFMEPYWMRHAADSAVVVSGWHRLSYFATDGEYQSVELEHHIRRLHRAVGNAVADDKHIIFGTGSMKLINALVHALSPDGTSSGAAMPPARMVVATAPYYPSYRTQTMMFDGRDYKWEGTTEAWAANASSQRGNRTFIEFVTSPNNPDSVPRKPVLSGGGNSRVIADHAYYWPHFTPIPSPADEDVMLFSASKLSGHAGSRFGWALVRDEELARRAKEYIEESSLGESRDTQLRMLSIIKVILANLHGKEDMFAFAHQAMSTRWTRFNTVVSGSRRISVEKISPQFCTYFNRTREPTPAFAWVKCERKQDQDCYDALLKANIITWSGVDGEASARYTRVSLVKARDDFDVLLERLTDFVNGGKQSAPTSSLLLPPDQLSKNKRLDQ